MNFYIRKLYSNELGVRKGVPKGAGRFILVNKTAKKEFLPQFSESTTSPSISLGFVNDQDKILYYCEYNWHNKKESKHLGKDARIYLNAAIDPDGKYFMPNDFLVFFKFKYEELTEVVSKKEIMFKIFLFKPDSEHYSKLEKISDGASHFFTDKLNFLNTKDLTFKNYIVSKKTKARIAQRKAKSDEDTCGSQNVFKEVIREAYDYKCAITGTAINFENNISKSLNTNLQAAHIKPDTFSGPLNQNNGILLNLDMHFAFDRGCISLNDNYEVIVHEKLNDSYLMHFNNRKIKLPKNKSFHPNIEYIKFHRKNIFGKLIPPTMWKKNILNNLQKSL